MLHVKKGDKVIILSGDEKGKTGKVLQIFPKQNRAIVEGVNIVHHHKKPKSAQEAGGITKSEAPIYLCKLQVICPSCGMPARVGFVKSGDEKSRVCKKCGKPIDSKEIKKEKTKAAKTTKKEDDAKEQTKKTQAKTTAQASKAQDATATEKQTTAKKATKKESAETVNTEA
ncbi:MAG: 50S ribosomal protein L24 [Clostridiales bacterium]|nr:50S ribosomal protein L24 [Clostridiales bacterium]